MGEGPETLIAISTDAAGNPSEGSEPVTVDTTAPVFDNGDTATVTITIGTAVAYDAAATDNGAGPDIGIVYTHDGDDAAQFTIGTTGVVTYITAPTAAITHILDITIEATDAAGNAAMQSVSIDVRAVPTVTITDSPVAGTANLADGNFTFIFSFSEDVAGFDDNRVTVTGGTRVSLTPTPVAATTYAATTMFTLVAAPTSGMNNGVLTVTVEADAATGETTNAGNAVASATQAYDTLVPPAPSINDVTADNTINVTESADGITLDGGVEDGASVAVCVNGAGTVAACTGGTTPTATAATTTWNAPLDSAAISALGSDGNYSLRAQATDAAGNPGPEADKPFMVDTTPPTIPTIGDVTADNIISGAEQTTTLAGTTDANTTIALCFGGTDNLCAGGTSRTAADGVIDPVGAGTTWSYPLNGAADITAIGQGEDVTLRVTARDAAGNPAHGSRVIEVDTTAPVFTSAAANTIAINSLIDVTAYDANARDNSRGTDEGITYTMSGTDVGEFTIVPETGIVTYNTVQTGEITHTITITATDEVGNAATLNNVAITVAIAPVLTITGSPDVDYIGNNEILILTYEFSEAVTGFTSGDISATNNGTTDGLFIHQRGIDRQWSPT